MSNKNILLTGSSYGLGKEIVEYFGKDIDIMGISRSKISEKEIGEKLYKELNYDLTNFQLFDTICEEIVKENTQFDGVIFNAGIGAFGEYAKLSPEKHQEIIKLNLLSPVLLLQKLLPYIKKGGKIIFIGSIISKKFMKHGAVYQASKFGLRGFAGALKQELKDQKVHIINPKILKTSFHEDAQIEITLPKNAYTEFGDVLRIIEDILNGKESRFEIDV